ncbi:MAG: restriction endonuclease subunit S [Thermodesulfovibrionales bacterium]|nr:restriction endonuclease subunit S [Thermodesulfovibrionales bacterium]
MKTKRNIKAPKSSMPLFESFQREDSKSEVITNNKPLPQGWVLVKLGEVCLEPQYGWTTSASKRGKLHLLRTSDITSETIEWDSVPFCKVEPPDIEKYILRDGDIVISRAGSVGFSHLIKNPKKAIFASYLIRFKPLINEQFLAYFLKSPSYWQSISEKSLGIAIPNVNASKLRQIPIPLPPLSEQKRIVAKIEELFTRLDAGVEALKKAKTLIMRYRQAVLKYAFNGKLTEEWRNNSKSLKENERKKANLNEEILRFAQNDKEKEANNDLPHLPEGWRWVRLGEVAEINPKFNGDDISDDIEVTFLPMKCVKELTGHLDLTNIKKLSEVKKGYTSFVDGDVLFAKITPCMENGKVAIAYNLRNSIGFGSTEFHVVRVGKLLLNKFLFFFFIREDFRKDAQRHMTGSAGQLRVPVSYMQQIYIPLPPLPEQHQIVSEIERRFSVIEQIERVVDQSLKQADRLRQSILKRAFEGKLVPQDPNDEPAEKLLERIKQKKEKNK